VITLFEIYFLISVIIGGVVFRNVLSQPHRYRIVRSIALGFLAVFVWPFVLREIVKWPQ
jgi:hypothetical protein